MKTNAGKTQLTSRTLLQTILYGLVGLAVLSNLGCVSSIQKAGFTDGTTYQENRGKIKPPAPDHGRLFMYQVKGAPNYWKNNPVGVMSICSVDSNVYRVLGGSYWYVDLPSGKHKVSLGVKLGHPWFSSKKVSYGKKTVDFDLKSGDTVYCSIDLSGYGAFRKSDVVLVDAQTAIAQLPPLLHMDKEHLEEYAIAE